MKGAVELPGAGFIAGTLVTTWLAQNMAGRVAWLLVAYSGVYLPPEEKVKITPKLTAICDALGLRPADEQPPNIGDRLAIGPRVTVLDYGHPSTLLRVPQPGPQWIEHARTSGQVLLAVGLEPIRPGSGQDAVDAYLHRFMPRGRVRLGVTGVRTR